MRLRVVCRTRFDITATGIRGHFHPGRTPFADAQGQIIRDNQSWTQSRNRQRNWETVNQIISLRCLPENITEPHRSKDQHLTSWSFEFEVPDPASIALDDDPVWWLRQDCQGVPMITGLDEDHGIGTSLDAGINGNIEFWLHSDK